MTTFYSRQSDRGRRVQKIANANALQTHVTNRATKLHGHVHEARKILCNNFQRAAQERVIGWSIYTREALPLVWTRFLRLANNSPKTARSPARRSRDSRATSGKTTGKISCVMSAQLPGNGRTMAMAMPPDGRADDSQDNLPCSRHGRAMSAPETCETTRLKSQP